MTDFVGEGIIALFYGHVASNIGDLAINRGELALLRRSFPDSTIRVVLMNSKESPYLARAKASFADDNCIEFVHFSAYDKLASMYVLDPYRFLVDCRADDASLLVLAAGEHLFSYSRNPNDRNLFWRSLPAFAARSCGQRCIHMPSTFGPFESNESRNLVRTLLATGTRAATRDVWSTSLLAAVDVGTQIETLLDPAFFLDTPKVRDTNPCKSYRTLGFVMRSEGWGLRLAQEDRDSKQRDGERDSLALRFSTNLAKRCLAAGIGVQLFAQTAVDKSLADSILAKCSESDGSERIEVVAPETINDYLLALGRVDGVVASRFHALVFALVAERPCFGIYFDVHGHKIPGLFELIGASDQCIKLAEESLESAADRILAWFDSADGVPTSILDRIQKLRRRTAVWMQGDWTQADSTHVANGLAIRVQALRPFALAIESDFEQRARDQRERLIDVETRFKDLSRKFDQFSSDFESTRKKLAYSEKRRRSADKKVADANAQLQALAESARSMESRLNEQLESSRKVIAARDRDLTVVRSKLKQERHTAKRKVADANAQLQALEESTRSREARLNEQLKSTRKAIVNRDRDLAIVRSKLKQEQRMGIKRTGLALKDRSALVYRIRQLEGSESFRIGYAIVRLLTAPIRFAKYLANPVAFRDASTGNSQAIPAASYALPPESPDDILTVDEMRNLHAQGGAKALVAAVLDRVPQDPFTTSTALVQVSRLATQNDLPEAEYHLVMAALGRSRSDQTLRASFWAAQRAGKVRDAWDYLTEIEELYGTDPEPGQSRWLQKARSGAIMNLALLDEIVLAPNPAYESRPNRICYVLHNSLPYSSGGYATRAHGMSRGLQEVGIEAVCITRPGYPFDVKPQLEGETLPSEDCIDDVRYFRLWEPRRGGSDLARYVRSAADSFEVQMRQLQPTLVMAASAHLSALPALIAARRLGIPFIYEVRGFWEITRLSREPEYIRKPHFHVQKLLEAEVANHADHVFTLTAPMRDELVERGVRAETISLLPNSCDPDRFVPRQRDRQLAARLNIPPDVPVIGYIGTFVQYEGLEHLAQACTILREHNMNFRLLLVGNEDTSNTGRGSITAEIERIAIEGNLTDWLIMPGRVPHEEVEAYYSLIDIAPFPRKPQPVTEMVSPMKPLEALSMEKAVVVSSVRALAEFVADGRTGLIFEKGNINDLAESLARLIADASLRERLGRAARKWVINERTWVATATIAKKTIAQLIDDSKRSYQSIPAELRSPKALSPAATVVPSQTDRKEVFASVRKLYAKKEHARGKTLYSFDDWQRTRLAFEMLDGARSVVDIGIGQAQLVNLLARCNDVDKVYGFDFRSYTSRIDPPNNGRFKYRDWDITQPLADPPDQVDVVVVMEVLEHIDVGLMPSAYDRLRRMSTSGSILITVPYREAAPLYHHKKPHGHKQSFDDAKIEELFGPRCLYSNYKQKWYFVFASDRLTQTEALTLKELCTRVPEILNQDLSAAVKPAARAVH